MPQKGKLEAEDKLKVVEKYLSGQLGCKEASRIAGVDTVTIRRWVNRYKAEGPTGLLSSAQNRSYSRETKLAAVQDYLSGKGNKWAICEKYKIKDPRQLSHWVKVYNRHKDFRILPGGSRMTKARETTIAERIEIVRACIASGNNYGEVAQKHQVSYQQVYTWTKKYRTMGEAGLEDRRGHRSGTLPSRTPEEELRDRVAQLERKNFELEMENTLLKKVKELERRRGLGL